MNEIDRSLREAVEGSLLQRATSGDPEAREQFWKIVLPHLRTFAHRRVPPHLRRLEETEDLVQRSILKVLDDLCRFEGREVEFFIATMRVSIRHLVIDDIRRYSKERPVSILGNEVAPTPSPEERAIESEVDASYEAALEQLQSRHPRLYVAQVLRSEFDLEYREIAAVTGQESADAARMAVNRARRVLAELLPRAG